MSETRLLLALSWVAGEGKDFEAEDAYYQNLWAEYGIPLGAGGVPDQVGPSKNYGVLPTPATHSILRVLKAGETVSWCPSQCFIHFGEVNHCFRHF